MTWNIYLTEQFEPPQSSEQIGKAETLARNRRCFRNNVASLLIAWTNSSLYPSTPRCNFQPLQKYVFVSLSLV